MNDNASIMAALFAGIVIGFIVGLLVFPPLVNNTWEAAVIKHDAAHYDPKTGAFTWNAEAKP